MQPCESVSAVELTGVEQRFGSIRAIDSLSLRVASGTVTGIVGPNGAGKTTLIDIICGLAKPASGTVRIFGETVVGGQSRVRARIGVLPQETALYDEVTARQNLRFAAALYDLPRPDRRIAEVLELVGLTARADDVVRKFSGGMQRRLAIARALLHNPSLLILDEPTVGVDVEARHQIWAHVRMLRAAGHTVILTTNYLDEAEALCDRVAILRSGRLVIEDTPAALSARTGRCLELKCRGDASDRIRAAAGNWPEVLRVEETGAAVLQVYLDVTVNPEDILGRLRVVAPIESFRSRSPDLSEVFRSLTSAAMATV